jgi:hypothetical protein
MSYELIGSGGIIDAAEFTSYESQLAEGDKALIELDLRLPVSQDIASSLEDQLKQRGIPGVKVVTASPMLQIYFTKGFPWLAVIAAIILGMITLAILIIGWRLYKEVVPAGLQPVVGAGISIGLLVIIGLVIVLLIRRR